MNNIDFYAAAATVIPLLLIAVMATRSLSPGELQRQPKSTVLLFGLPVVGELAAFTFLFFAPLPPASAVILAIVTWLGLVSQLALALWWLIELIKHDPPIAKGQVTHEVESPAHISTAPALGDNPGAAEHSSPAAEIDSSIAAKGSSPKICRCPRCQGVGGIRCPTCAGTFFLKGDEPNVDSRCQTCDGTGRASCLVCAGTGFVMEVVRYEPVTKDLNRPRQC